MLKELQACFFLHMDVYKEMVRVTMTVVHKQLGGL